MVRRERFGATGAEIPVIGQGSWDLPEHGARRTEALRALRRGIDLGLTHLDTAEMYGSGAVERILGEAIATIPRERVFLASKVLPSNASRSGVKAACERSLKRLRTEYLDLYLLHWPSSVPLEDTMEGFAQLVREGKTRFVGVSNFDLSHMLEAQRLLAPIPLACNQVLYHLNERGIEREIVASGLQAGIAIVGYTPFGRAAFPHAAAQPGGVLAKIAQKHAASARQVILAFLTRTSGVFTIAKASSVCHVEENASAANLVLDAQDCEQIDAAFPIGPAGPLATL
jgi:diketogulonate reductase-like aldo/keto reductase